MTLAAAKRPVVPRKVADLAGGEIVLAADGNVWQVGTLAHESAEGKHRWGRMLREDRTETDRVLFLHPNMAVLEVLEERRTRTAGGGEVDPLRMPKNGARR